MTFDWLTKNTFTVLHQSGIEREKERERERERESESKSKRKKRSKEVMLIHNYFSTIVFTYFNLSYKFVYLYVYVSDLIGFTFLLSSI